MTLIGDPIIMYTSRLAHTNIIVVYRKIRQNSEEILFCYVSTLYITQRTIYIKNYLPLYKLTV